jgi:hypothetical protein
MIDGGVQYIRRTWYEDDNGEDLSVYTDDPHSKIREWFRWGTYGKEGKGPLVWKKLKFLSTDHINRILDEGYARAHLSKVFQDELTFRKGKPLAVLVNELENGSYKVCYDSVNYTLRGVCISHEGRPDLEGRWITSSSIVHQLSDKTYETLNTIYNVISPEETEIEQIYLRPFNT